MIEFWVATLCGSFFFQPYRARHFEVAKSIAAAFASQSRKFMKAHNANVHLKPGLHRGITVAVCRAVIWVELDLSSVRDRCLQQGLLHYIKRPTCFSHSLVCKLELRTQ